MNNAHKILLVLSASFPAFYGCKHGAIEEENSGLAAITTEAEIVNGVYEIRSVMSGKCLDVPGNTTANVFIQQYTCNGTNAQRWRITRVDGPWFNITNAGNGKALDVLNWSTADGARIIQYPLGNNQANQQFAISGSGGRFAIRSRHSNRVLDVFEFGTADGAPIQQWGDAGSGNQRWILTRLGAAGPRPPQPPAPPATPVPPPANNGWRLVWSDEFNGPAIDRSKWNFEILKPGTFNSERQGYTNRPENARIEGGMLVIETRKDNFQGQSYTSARLNTRGKAFWRYGRIEARLKFTSALGTWPAFWMMPEDQSRGWPTCGEIDIMENVGYEGDVIHGTTHVQKFFAGNGRGGSRTVPNITADFHTYAIEWYADRIDWFVDGQKYFTQRNDGGEDVYPFHKPFHVILNFALGGTWGGAKGFNENMGNQRMWVDYVRVYQK